MASRLLNHNIEAHRPVSEEDLKRRFERAVCELHQADVVAKKHLKHHSPLVPRRRILGISQADAEKRAVLDAARALAELWKV